MADKILNRAADCPIPVLSGTQSSSIVVEPWILDYFSYAELTIPVQNSADLLIEQYQ